MKKEEAEILKQKMNSKNKWKHLKENDDSKIPTRVNIKGEDVRSPKTLAEEFNNFFIDKTENTRKNFNDKDETALNILGKLIDKPTTEFKFKPINVYEAYQRIEKVKSSNSSGRD